MQLLYQYKWAMASRIRAVLNIWKLNKNYVANNSHFTLSGVGHSFWKIMNMQHLGTCLLWNDAGKMKQKWIKKNEKKRPGNSKVHNAPWDCFRGLFSVFSPPPPTPLSKKKMLCDTLSMLLFPSLYTKRMANSQHTRSQHTRTQSFIVINEAVQKRQRFLTILSKPPFFSSTLHLGRGRNQAYFGCEWLRLSQI